jgi:hypothetical protein
MKILIRLTVSLLLVSVLLGLNHELVLRTVVLLVLVGALIKCTQAALSTPSPAPAPALAEALPTGHASPGGYLQYPTRQTTVL